jgi:hypothetical protein
MIGGDVERLAKQCLAFLLSKKAKQCLAFFENKPPFTLPWSHYLVLMRIENENEGL